MYRNNKNRKLPTVKVIPLGGLGQIGMNITAFEYDNQIIIVDCGQAFPSEDMPGIDLVIPDVTYLLENRDKVKGLFITHGHEDHIGAIPYILKQINMPIYATKLTMALIDLKLEEHKLLNTVSRKTVKYGSIINLGDFRVEYIRSTHSIQDSAMLAINTPVGTILHTGDFKVDFTPIYGEATDFTRLAEIGKKGVLAMLCDSTNVLKSGYTASERNVGKKFDNIFAENKKRRIIVATFASNVDRVQQIVDIAHKYKRKVFVEGRSMVKIINVASELNYLHLPENIIESTSNIDNYPDEKIVLITTGSQGEAMAALSRIAQSTHKIVKIKPNDVVVFSSSPIPGNEKSVGKLINELSEKGAKVIVEDTHVSGHACQEEIKLIYSLVKPKFSIPAHGEYRHLVAHKKLVKTMGYDDKNIFILKCGNVLSLDREKGMMLSDVPSGDVYVDGLGVGDVGNLVIKDRQQMSEAGVVVISAVIDKNRRSIIDGPNIVTRGFVFAKEYTDLINEAHNVASEVIDNHLNSGHLEWTKLKIDLKDNIGRLMWKNTKRRPLVIPTIMEG